MNDIAVDTSTIVELMVNGPKENAVDSALSEADRVFVTSVARVEAAMVVIGRFGWDRTTFDRYWEGSCSTGGSGRCRVSELAISAF